jgi:hypothetical protein
MTRHARLVTVLLTLEVPDEADSDDAAGHDLAARRFRQFASSFRRRLEVDREGGPRI